MTGTETLAFSLLGPVRGWRDGTELALGGAQQRAALAVLLLRGGRPVAVEELVDGLWGTAPPKSATPIVRTYVSRLRTLLEPGHRRHGGPGLLVTVGSSYALRVPERAVDLAEAEREAASAGRAREAGDLVGARALVRRALERWQGVPLAGLTGPFAEDRREQLDRLHLGLVETGIELDLALGEAAAAATAVSALTALTAEHPLRESLRLLLMRALFRCGRPAEALAVYEETRALLAAELDTAPDPRLAELHLRILRSDPTLLPPAPPEPPRLPKPAQLPADTPDFTGREELLHGLTELLRAPAAPAVRICALHGIGGAGKTTLAVRAAHAVRSAFPDGQLYVDLAGVADRPADPAAVLGRLLRALGVSEAGLPDDPEARAALYRSMLADRKVLLLLDNARDADQVLPLLPGDPGCAVLVTSRARLTALPATQVEVDAFRLDEALELLTTVLGADRVLAEFTAAADLSETCGHLPLAVRIIACRLLARPDGTLADCLRRLADERRRLGRLRAGELDVQACFRLGYDQLAPELARAFRLLALPRSATISLPCAAALLGADEADTERLLEELLHTGLLQSLHDGRYRYHDLLRLFARERLAETESAQDTDGAAARLMDLLLGTVRDAYRVVRPGHRIAELLGSRRGPGTDFPDATAAHAWFDQEREFVLDVLGQTVRTLPALVGPAADVLLGLDPLLERAFAWPDAVAPSRALADAARRAGLPRAEAGARYMLAGGLWQVGKSAEAAAHIDRTEALCREHDLPVLLAEALNVQAMVACSTEGFTEESVALFAGILALQRRIGNRSGEANTLNNLVVTCVRIGRAAEAAEHSAAGLALYRALGDGTGEARALVCRGLALTLLGESQEALDCFQDGLRVSRERRLPDVEAHVLHHLATAHLRRGEPEPADAAAEQSRALSHEIGLPRAEARALVVRGRALDALGHRDRAVTCLREAVAISQLLGLAELREAEVALAQITG
ncbi:AfsR/SARP family transcriptional regulator [Streptomyces sp. CBMA156]|uniref:AfsR/SARP family transcriptional regulator n=1 Tax=Streptomyces sp. CBMA156 TaxID=1930280 RepID=UPI001662014D|nr:BTAD domain-containing putative transcriptional regulator [Streptomyces sp. CBMA156]